MARSNDTNTQERIITPITNCKWFQCTLFAKQAQENFNTKVFFYLEPSRDTFISDEDYQKSKEIYDHNFAQYSKILEAHNKNDKDNPLFKLEAKEVLNGRGIKIGYEYEVDLTKTLANGNLVQSISGRLLNFYHITDTLKQGDVKPKWIAEVFDFEKNEKYTVTMSIAVIGRKVIDALCSLSSEQLKHNIEIALIQYQYNNVWQSKTEVTVLDPTFDYGRNLVKGTYEISVWDDANKKRVSTPNGSKADNTEFLSALNAKLNKQRDADMLFIEFYKRMTFAFQANTLHKFVTDMFLTLGWETEFREEIKEKQVKKGKNPEITISEKTREILFLTPLNSTKSSNEIPTTSKEVEDSKEISEDLPF